MKFLDLFRRQASPLIARRAPLAAALEPRMLFDGAIAATAVEAASSTDHQPTDNAQAQTADDATQQTSDAATPPASSDQRQEVVFIDGAVTNKQQLIDGLKPGIEVVMLDSSKDGLQQIADYLEGREGIDAIHILSHGDSGKVKLGDTWLDSAQIAANSALLADIGRSLDSSGDILLYGCHVGADGTGVEFIQSLAAATGADVAASSDLTGSVSKGGDWVLEATQGSIETVSFDLGSYSGLLVAFSDDFASGVGAAVTSFTRILGGVSFTFTFTADGEGGDFALDPGNGFGGSSSINMQSTGPGAGTERITIARTDGADFAFSSIFIDNASGGTTNVRGYLDGSAVGTNQTMAAAASGTLSFSDIRVDQVQITSTDFFGTNFDNFAGDTTPPNSAPVIANINGNVAWAGVGNAVILDAGANASLTDAELGALNSGNGNWSGASLTVQRPGTAIAADTFGFTASGLFTVSGNNLQSGGQTFATFTNTGGVLTINFTSSGTTATTALVNDVARHINYRNDTPSGDTALRFTLSDGIGSTTADVTVTSDTIYVTNATDTATINVSNGVSFSEAVAIAAADGSGSQTIAFASSLASTALTINSVSLNESLTFDMDAASGMSLTSGTLTLGAATTQTFTNGTGDTATLSSVIAGSGAFTKAGAGGLTLSGTNTYSGATTVSAGILTVSGGDAISSNSSVAVAGGATLALSNNETIGNLSGAGAITLGSNTLTSIITADTTFSGGLSGTGGLSVSQSGAATFALTLSGSNTYTGNTTAVNFGWLKLNGDASVSSSSALRADGNSIITLQSDQTVGSLASNNAGASIQLGAFTLSAGGDNTSTTVAGVLSGTGNLVKQGSGTLTLAGTNTYSGTTTVSAGTLSVASDSNLGSNTVTLAAGSTLEIAGATTIDNAISLSGDATVSNLADATLSGIISGANTLTKAGASTLTLSNTNTYAGTTISAGTLSVAGDNNLGSGTVTLASGSTLAVTGATNIDNTIALTGDATVSTSANATLSGVISGANTLTKAGVSTLTLSNTNTYAGTTVSAGTLSVASDGNLGSGAVSLAGGTTLAISGATTIDNAIALAGNATVSTSANATLSGVISGANTLTKAGVSTLTLSNTNAYAGTTVSAGTLSVSSDANLGSGAVTLSSGSTLAVTGATTIDNAIALSGGTATVNASANTTLSGNITGAGGLTKTGANTLTLSGTDSYTGATNVNAGTLLVNGALSATSNTTVASAATLGGDGSISNDVTVNSGGTLSPGNSAGTLTLNGNLTMASGSTLAVEINGTAAGTQYDQVIVNGTVDVSGATLSTTHGYTPGSGDSYTIIVNDMADAVTGNFTGIAEGDSFTAGGNSTQLTASYIGGTGNDFTLTAPLTPTVTSVTVVEANGTYAIGSTVTVAVNFSEAVFLSTGTIQLVLETGTTDRELSYLAGSGSSTLYFNYTVQEGDISSDLDYISSAGLVANGDTIQSGTFINANLTLPTPGAAGSLGANKDIVIDGVRPTASIVVDDTALALGQTATVTITFNEAVSGLATADFTVANGVLSGLSSSDGGITWTATLTPNASVADTSNLITLDNTGVVDVVGNAGTGTTDSNNYAIDTLRPTASIVVADTALAAGETTTVTITFNEAVSGLAIADFTVANGVLSGLSSADGGITWTATLTPNASVADTSNLITLDNTGVADQAGNTGTGSTDSNNYAIDTLRPTASIVVADTALAAGETSTVTITFSEAVSGLTSADFTVANGVLSGLSSADGGITWTAILTPDASVADTSNLITLDNTGVVDVAGNAGAGTTDSNNYAIDTLRPTASIVVADTALALGETTTVTITFNEAVSGLTSADFTVANGVLSGLSSADGGITWTATLTPNVSVADTSNLITLDNTGVVDVAGNAGAGTTDSNNYAIDTLRPTASIVVADTALALGETTTVTITFNEAVSGLTSADFTVANGVLSGLSSADGGITWTATLTPTASIEDPSNLITLDNTGIADQAGNTGTGSTDSNNYAIDTLRPSASIVVADTALAAGETSTVTITFSEAVSGLTSADFTVANGVLSGLSSADGGITWTAILTPDASVADTSNLITLDNTGVVDVAGNAGAGTTDSNNYAIDTLRPTASIVVADTALALGETSTITITFSEAVSGLTSADFTVANGVLSGLSSADGGITWTATLTPNVSVADTSNLITLDNTGVVDVAGNAGAGTTDSNNYAIDTLRPTASIVVSDTALALGETTTVTITFNEAVSGLAIADFTVANGVLSGLSSADGGITWTATLTPTASIEDPSNLITLDNTGIADQAGNTGTGSTDSNNYAIDTLRPSASIVVADTALVAGETSTVTITFSEAVSGLTSADFTVANGVLSGLSSVDGGITWTATLAPNSNVADTSNVITLDNAGVQDAAGNNGTGATDSNNYTIDTLPPSVASVGVPANGTYVAGQNLDFTVNFNDAVVVDSSGGTPRIAITLDSGGSVFADYVSGSGSSALVFRLTVASGQMDSNGISVGNSINLNGATLRDAVGNNAVTTLNGVGGTSAVLVDALAPNVISVVVPANDQYNAGDVLIFTVNANEALIVDTAGGAPRIALDIGGAIRYASYVSGSGSAALVFQYSVQTSDSDANGIAVGSGLELNGATVRDGAGNNLTLTLNSVGSTAEVIVDTTAPLAESLVRVDASPSSAGSVRFTLTFNEAVSGVNTSDFVLTSTGNAAGTIQSVVQIDARTYQVIVGGVSGNGSLGINLSATATDIADVAGNALTVGITGERYVIATSGRDPEFLATPPAANLPTLNPLIPPATPVVSLPLTTSPLLPPPLFEVPTLGSGIPTLGNIFINNGALAPSFIAQVFASSGSDSGGDGSGSGFLGFGGGDGGVFGSSTLSSIFGSDAMQESEQLEVFDGKQWRGGDAAQGLRGVFGAPTLGQQLHEIRDNEQRQLNELAWAFGQVVVNEPHA